MCGEAMHLRVRTWVKAFVPWWSNAFQRRMGCLQATVLVVAMAMGVLLLPYDPMFTDGFERVNTTHLSQVGSSSFRRLLLWAQ